MATRDPNAPAPRFESLEPPRLQTPADGGAPVPVSPPPPPSAGRRRPERSTSPADRAGTSDTGAASSAAATAPAGPPGEAAAPLRNAAAITYRSDAGPPRIVAKGRGLIAEQIIARAKEHGVAVHESRELVALLMQVELDAHIPPALYRAVAELLAWLYHIEAARLKGGKV